MEEHDGGGGYTGGRRSLRYEFSREPNGSTASVTLGGILSIKETTSSSSPSYRIHNRTLLDLIRTDPTTGNNDSKKPWKMFRDKLRLKLSGSVCTTTVPILASLVHINTVTDNNRTVSTTPEHATIQLNSPSVSNGNGNSNGNVNSNGNSSSVAVTQPENSTSMLNSAPVSNDNTGSVSDTQTENVRSEPTVKVSLMRLLEVDGSACFEDDDDDGDDVVVGGGDDGGDGGGGYNNCCVCMVRHKGAAFIPCGHTFCRLCSRELFVKRANCPLCNNFISEILDIF